jgi:hypothetical protein
MPDYNKADFCQPAFGVKYIFAKMRIIYGKRFDSNWEGIEQNSINETWKILLGVYATYRPNLEFALANMDSKFIPSAIEFRDLCRDAGRIPEKPHSMITRQRTLEEIALGVVSREKELKKLRVFYRKVTN